MRKKGGSASFFPAGAARFQRRFRAQGGKGRGAFYAHLLRYFPSCRKKGRVERPFFEGMFGTEAGSGKAFSGCVIPESRPKRGGQGAFLPAALMFKARASSESHLPRRLVPVRFPGRKAPRTSGQARRPFGVLPRGRLPAPVAQAQFSSSSSSSSTASVTKSKATRSMGVSGS